jgi:hypothetical protein
MADGPGSRPPLAQPWAGGLVGWVVAVGALVAELVAGIVTNSATTSVAAAVLAFPVAVALAVSIVQWQQVRTSGADRTSWWHLAGIAAAVVTWQAWPTSPGVLYGTASARNACHALGQSTRATDCLARAIDAMDAKNLVWWLTGALILILALLVRRSRIAAWAAIPAAVGGCLLATHFLEQLLLHYQPGG